MSFRADDTCRTDIEESLRRIVDEARRTPPKKFAVTGKATVTKKPSTIRIAVKVRCSGPDRARAYEAFQKRLKDLTDAIAASGEHRVSAPSERETPDPKGRSTGSRFVVMATVHISIALDAFGEILHVLIEQDLPFDEPTFEFDTESLSVAELARNAALAAREKALAIADGAGFALGDVHAVDCGDMRITEPKLVYLERERNRWLEAFVRQSRVGEVVMPRIANLFGRGESELEPETPELDQSILSLLNTDMPTQEQSATVTIEYEIHPIKVTV